MVNNMKKAIKYWVKNKMQILYVTLAQYYPWMHKQNEKRKIQQNSSSDYL